MIRSIWIERFLDLLFPARCAGCRQLGELMCAACCTTLTPYPAEARPPPAGLAAVEVAFVFDGVLRTAVHQLKYRRAARMAVPLGRLLAAYAKQRGLEADAVVAVPLHAARQAERGYNQAELLAREIATELDVPLVTRGFVRLRATAQQAKQADGYQRQANMHGAFAWVDRQLPPSLLLVDDVLTTGATMAACAAALQAAGARQITGLALARSRLKA